MKLQLSSTAVLFHADCRDALRLQPDNSVDAVVTDPPYELNFMGKGWDDTGIANDPALWREVLRVLKPGGHLAAFSASRTYHRMACAIEDAGFEIRDSLMWIYGTGFPKSQNVAKFIDKELGAEGEKIATGAAVKRMIPGADQNKDGWIKDDGREFIPHEYAPASSAAQEFDGFGTALKPAFEPIVLARKPLSEPTVAANVLRWRTGALNIDGCRVAAADGDAPVSWTAPPGGTLLDPFAGSGTTGAAARQEGFACILCEREAEYVADIRARFDLTGPVLRFDPAALARAREAECYLLALAARLAA